jgi:hypothetical protein
MDFFEWKYQWQSWEFENEWTELMRVISGGNGTNDSFLSYLLEVTKRMSVNYVTY